MLRVKSLTRKSAVSTTVVVNNEEPERESFNQKYIKMPQLTKTSEEFGESIEIYNIFAIYFISNITDVVKYFLQLLDDDKDLSSGIAAIKTLLMILEKKQCK